MHIAISGNIGSGKTTLTKKLSAHFKWTPLFEPIDQNPYLTDFYQDMQKWAFQLQVHFLGSRFDHIGRIGNVKSPVVQDRSIYEDAYIFALNLFQLGLLNQRDYNNYKLLFDSMIRYVEPPELLVYLKADVKKLLSQIQARGRKYELDISKEYLESLNHLYEQWIHNYSLGKVLVIDVNHKDFVTNNSDFMEVVNGIKEILDQ